MAEWARVVNTTTRQFIRDEEVNILRNRKVTAMAKSRGRIKMNAGGGDKLDWKVRFKRAPMTGFADTDTLSFSRQNRWKTAELDWRGYASTDSMTKREKLINTSVEAIIKVYDQIARNLMDDMEDQFADEFYIDGNATGNSKRIHGLESFCGVTGAYSGGFVGDPSDTYANLSTVLGNYGGAWSGTTWPIGTGDAHYDFWSPTLVDYTDTAWEASTKTWPNTCIEALRFGILHAQKNKSKKGMLDMIVLDTELYRQFLAKLEAKENIYVSRGKSSEGLQTLGFTDVQNFDGVDVTSEYGLPAATGNTGAIAGISGTRVGYGFNFDHLELCSLQSQLFVPEGPDFDIASQSWRFSVDFYGNMRCNPRYFVKWASHT